MTVSGSIELTDFGSDVLGAISPILDAIGLLDANGKLDIGGWNLNKAMGIFKTYERTSSILDFLCLFTNEPSVRYRQLVDENGGLSGIVSSLRTDSSYNYEEEWFKLFEVNLNNVSTPLKFSLIVNQEKLNPFGDGTHGQELVLGLGVECESYEFELPIGGTKHYLSGIISLPLIKVVSDQSGITTSSLLFSQTDAAQHRPAISVSMMGENTYSPPGPMTTPACDGFGLKLALGGLSSSKVILSVYSFQSTDTSPIEDLIISDWGGSNLLGNIFEKITEMLVDKLPSGLSDDILPLLGLAESVFKTNGTLAIWPLINLYNLFFNKDDDNHMLNYIKNWLFEITNDTNKGYWLAHLGSLLGLNIDAVNVHTNSITTEGELTFFTILNELSGTIFFEQTTDVNQIDWLHIGVGVSYEKSLSAVTLTGNLDLRLVSIPLQNSEEIQFLPLIELFAELKHSQWTTFSPPDANPRDINHNLLDISGNPDFDNLTFSVNSAKFGIKLVDLNSIDPLIELHHVERGNAAPGGTGDYWEVLDLLSADTADDLISSVLNGVSDTLSDFLADDGFFQWFGSLLGLVSPRSGDFRDKWEGNAGLLDSRINLIDLVTDPLRTISNYHTNLMDNTWDNTSTPKWSYLFESFGHILQSIINLTEGEDLVVMRTDDSPHFMTPLTYSFDSESIPIPIHLIAELEEDPNNGGYYDVQFDAVMRFFSLPIGVSQTFSIETRIGIASLHWPKESNTTGDIEGELFSNVRLGGYLRSNDLSRIEVFNLGGVQFNLEEVRIEGGWQKGLGFNWEVALDTPFFGTVMPDMVGLVQTMQGNAMDLNELHQLSWNGYILKLPDGTKINPLNTTNPANPGLANVSTSITFDSGSNTTLSWLFDSFNCNKIWLDRNGINGLIGVGQTNFMDIDLATSNPSDILLLPGLMEFIGQFLAMRCGAFGFFLGTFFRLNPNLIYLDLENEVRRYGATLSHQYSLIDEMPDQWNYMYFMEDGKFGLGPFSLPHDWPILAVDTMPTEGIWEVLKDYIITIFTTSSNSGEPFAFPALRWISALLSKHIPDLSKKDLGWKQRPNSNEMKIEAPKFTTSIEGAGTYENPWKISLASLGIEKLSVITWLTPDGPDSSEDIAQIKSLLGSSIKAMLDGTTQFDSAAVESEVGHSGLSIIADMIYQLARYSPKVQHAIGRMTKQEIVESFLELRRFLKMGDGLSLIGEQLSHDDDVTNNTNGPIVHANHFTVLNEIHTIHEVLEIIRELQDLPSLQSTSLKLLFVAPHWMGAHAWDSFANDVTAQLSFSNQSIHSIDFGTTPTTITGLKLNPDFVSINNHQMVSIQLGLTPLLGANRSEYVSEQFKIVIEKMTQSNEKVILICHSLAGIFCSRFLDFIEKTSFESKVAGFVAIASPNPDHTENDGWISIAEKAIHLLELISMIRQNNFDVSTVSPSDILDGNSFDQLMTFYSEIHKSLGV